MSYDAVVFDNDGVLLEVTDEDDARYREGVRAAFHELGVPAPRDEHVGALLYGVTVERLDAVCDAYGLDPAEFWAARDRHCARVQREQIREGGKGPYDDVAALDDLACPLGIVSANQHETVAFVLEHFGLVDRFDTYYGRRPTVADLRRKKPDPHYLERAVADLGAREALFVGDSESDVRAAANAGVDSAFLRRPHRADYDLSVDPTYTLDGLEGLPELVEG